MKIWPHVAHPPEKKFFLINKGQNPALVVFKLTWVKPPEAAPRVHVCVALTRCLCMRQQRHFGKSFFLLGNAFRVLLHQEKPRNQL